MTTQNHKDDAALVAQKKHQKTHCIAINPNMMVTMMAQARVLTDKELKQVLNYNDACERHAARNRLMLLLTHWAGMRIGEVVALRVTDVVDKDNKPKL